MSQILHSYIIDRQTVKHSEEYSGLKKICAEVPQGSVLGHVLFLLCTNDIQQTDEVVTSDQQE